MDPPELIGEYEIEEIVRIELLGRVARGRAPGAGRVVLIRELTPPPGLPAVEREQVIRAFEEECFRLGAVADSRVPRPLSSGISSSAVPFLVYDVPGSWEPVPREPRARQPEEWLHLAREIGKALSALADAGVPLAYVEPEYVFESPDGAAHFLPLGFGRLLFHHARQLAGGWGPPFASPELLRTGEITEPSLVFSLAAWVYQMLAGEPAPVGRGWEPLWRKHPSLPSALDDVLARALSPDPGGRYQTVAELVMALSTCRVAPRPEPERTAALRPRAVEPVEYPAWQYLAWGAGMGLAGSLIGWVLGRVVPLP